MNTQTKNRRTPLSIPFQRYLKVGKRFATDFNQQRWRDDIVSLEALADNTNKFMEIMGRINSELNTNFQTLKELEAHLLKVTGFRNIEVASDAFLIKGLYLEAKENNILVDEIDENRYEWVDGRLQLKESYVEQLKEKYTTYILPEYEEAWRKIDEFIEWFEQQPYKIKRSLDFNGRIFPRAGVLTTKGD